MTKEWNKEAHDHVFSALREMLKWEPFYAHLAFNLPWVQKSLKNDIFSTDGASVVYDPDKIMALMSDPYSPLEFNSHIGARNQPEVMWALPEKIITALAAATLTRIALRHPFRAERWGMSNPERQDIASDSAIFHIVGDIFGRFPSKAHAERIKDASRMVFEQIYDRIKLPPTPPKPPAGGVGGSGMSAPGSGADGGSKPHSAFGNPVDGEGDSEADTAEIEEGIKQAVERASKKAKEAGKLPGKLMAEIERVNATKKDWREELRMFLGGGQSKEQSWSKPSRRHIADDLYLPGMPPSGPGVVVLAIDTSGSVDDSLLSRFVAEINKVNEDLQPEEIHVVCCDTHVQWSECFGPYDSVIAKPLGRGGTRFSPVFEWVKKMGIEPKALLYFTDLECSDFGTKPDYPVRWVLWPDGSNRAPPFGEVIKMD